MELQAGEWGFSRPEIAQKGWSLPSAQGVGGRRVDRAASSVHEGAMETQNHQLCRSTVGLEMGGTTGLEQGTGNALPAHQSDADIQRAPHSCLTTVSLVATPAHSDMKYLAKCVVVAALETMIPRPASPNTQVTLVSRTPEPRSAQLSDPSSSVSSGRCWFYSWILKGQAFLQGRKPFPGSSAHRASHRCSGRAVSSSQDG